MNANTATALALLVSAACGFASRGAHATATIVINNVDGANIGFNDPGTPNAFAGCQVGETLGQCRLRVFTVAANQWGQLLDSQCHHHRRRFDDVADVQRHLGRAGVCRTANGTREFRQRAARQYRLCTSRSELAGRHGFVVGQRRHHRQFQRRHRQRHVSDRNSRLVVRHRSGTVTIPASRIPLLPVVFHELAHGLGFVSLYSTSTGAALTSSTPILGLLPLRRLHQRVVEEHDQCPAAGFHDQRSQSGWTGPRTSKQSTKFLAKPAAVIVNSPAGIAGAYAAQTASYGPSVLNAPVTASVVLANDGTGTVTDACEALTNGAAVSGNIALVDRGNCNFTVKVKNAQNVGAVGVIVANNTTGLPPMGGTDATITIPALGVTQALGTSIQANLPGVNATLGVDASQPLAGTNSGCVRMFAPNPVQGGSSVSHFHSDAFPNLLMEPALNTSIFNKVDLTLPLFQDIGWNAQPEDILFIDGFDPSPCSFVQP